jgi:hypothetical protein
MRLRREGTSKRPHVEIVKKGLTIVTFKLGPARDVMWCLASVQPGSLCVRKERARGHKWKMRTEEESLELKVHRGSNMNWRIIEYVIIAT